MLGCVLVCLSVGMSTGDSNPLPNPEDPGRLGLAQETVDAMVKKSLETQLAAMAQQTSSTSSESGGTWLTNLY